MVKEAKSLAAISGQIVVKIPMIKEGIKAIKYLASEGIKTNCTLVFSPGQALLAAKAGATYISPFIGRLDDIASDGLALVRDIRLILDNYHYKSQIIASSIRNPMHIINCAKMGVDVVTSPLASILGLLKHPLTDSASKNF